MTAKSYPTNEIGKVIKRYRYASELSLERFAAKLGIGFSAVYRWERSQSRITEHNFLKLCKLFGSEFVDEVTDILRIDLDGHFRKKQVTTYSGLLRKYMAQHDFNIFELSKKCFTSRKTVGQWLSRNHIPWAQETRLCQIFGEDFKKELEALRDLGVPAFEKYHARIQQGHLLKRFRQDKNWSQMTLGAKLGITHARICNWEKGDIIPEEHKYRMFELFGQEFRNAYLELEPKEDRRMTLTALFKKHLQKQGMTQVTLAQRLGTTQATISRYGRFDKPLPEIFEAKCFEILGEAFKQEYLELMHQVEPLQQAS
jgi:transcriptional regulator with XRE-family HTH domain